MIASEGLENFGINRLAKAAGVSPATIYIYYKDKDDLIHSIVKEETEKWVAVLFKNFDPEMSFEEGLWVQWKNRADHALKHRDINLFMEKIRNTSFGREQQLRISQYMQNYMGDFVKNAIARDEISFTSIEVYWVVAFAPLYTLVKFHQEGRSIAGKSFKLSDKIMKETFAHVIKALKK
ncbi:MAG: TetR/AcrR family transcriptional regulator [Chitinophaga sp.]|uniref:TetR/AcrR family transcriptional regulator n=1 Tax=Chitinophaga sp. TaxID=1869181 RepID=UPI0025C1219A|nr:TetR/AcrR family transcriptional regulator [Chitinophaga sp.]MBV8251592.1 TetR/AcrR family transcriptional regulator [Chitinophaga sp.]